MLSDFKNLKIFYSINNANVLLIAASYGHINICEFLLTTKSIEINPNDTDYLDNTALHKASEGQYLDLAKLLMEYMNKETIFSLNQDKHSVLEVWGTKYNSDICDENLKTQFRIHIDTIFADVL